ncbi:MAG: peptidyl-prolyl cis-trans isomerase [Melioribacteraceae bacterium]|nr:peptidyl-prolyl cis-trans isomerase [Melioribacteraceae bacterium]
MKLSLILDVDEVSDIVESRFGYHIIKLNEVKDYPPLEEQKSNLKSIYQKSNYLRDKGEFINSLKERYSYQVNQAVWDSVAEGDNKLVIGDTYWGSDLEQSYGDSLLFQINGKDYKVNDIMTELSENENYKIGRMTKAVMYKAFTEKTEEKLFFEKAYELSQGDTEFAKLMDDYRNGLYIFELQEDEIWNNIEIDSTKLVELYEENKSDYMWPERVTYKVIYRRNADRAKSDLEKVNSGVPFDEVVEENSKDINLQKRSGLRELQIAASNQIAEKAYGLDNPGDISDVFEVGGGWYFVELVEKVPPQQKTFEEAQPELVGVWQEQQTKKLEDAYLNRLKEIYEPEIYYDRLFQSDED